MLTREATGAIFSVFDLTHRGLEPPTFRTMNERSIHLVLTCSVLVDQGKPLLSRVWIIGLLV